MKNHIIDITDLGGRFETVLASSSSEDKRLSAILSIDSDGAWNTTFEVLFGVGQINSFQGLSAAVRIYNSL